MVTAIAHQHPRQSVDPGNGVGLCPSRINIRDNPLAQPTALGYAHRASTPATIRWPSQRRWVTLITHQHPRQSVDPANGVGLRPSRINARDNPLAWPIGFDA
ncbi:TPA: hypothetical protein I8Y22_001142 [Raoultella planticola]|nr:hypothetical protein [Raoultella planticola]